MAASRPEGEKSSPVPGAARGMPVRHAIREQDALWTEFLALGTSVVDALGKSVQALCEGRFDLVEDVKNEEEYTDGREVVIEQECLRILALYEPLASDLRRMATILKVNRDWERIADLALRVARRARKLSRSASGVTMPESMKQLARDMLVQVQRSSEALKAEDAEAAREVVEGDRTVDVQYRAIQKDLKAQMVQRPECVNDFLLLLNTARNLERIADHAVGIAQTIVYLREGLIIRHAPRTKPSDS